MEEFIARLLDLQDCDRDIDRLKADLESIPREMKIHRNDTQGHEDRFNQFRDTLDGIKQKQKKLAGDRADNIARVADYKSRLISLKSNTEYTAMLQQIANTEKMNDQIDNLII
jgi:predicted  nucleic acid-binding Zn-ribbon protein